MARGRIAGVPVDISRTGYTGDLGYEVWMPWDRAIDVWDALIAVGKASTPSPPACWRWTWRASRPGCC